MALVFKPKIIKNVIDVSLHGILTKHTGIGCITISYSDFGGQNVKMHMSKVSSFTVSSICMYL